MLSGFLSALFTACDGGADSDSLDQDADPSGPADCSTDACGGDPTGDWVVSDVCFEYPQEPSDCTDSYYQIVGVDVEGTVSFREDGRYESVIAVTFDYLGHIGPECLEGVTCDEYEAGHDGTDCVDVPDGACDCTLTAVYPATEDFGGWSASGDELSMRTGTDGEDSEPWVTGFCVLGDTMWWNQVSDEEADVSLLLRRN